MVATDRYAVSSLSDLLSSVPEKFVTPETARDMASLAYKRAGYLSNKAEDCIGVSVQANIVTDRIKRGDHHCWIAVQDSKGVSFYGLVLNKGKRNRIGEEMVVSQLIIKSIAEACQISDPVAVDLTENEHIITYHELAEKPLRLLTRSNFMQV